MDLALYYAGLFDGEGHIGITKSKPTGRMKSPRFGIRAIVNLTHEPTIRALKDFVGHGVISSTKFKKNKRCWRLCLTGMDCINFLKTIEPFCVIKKEEILVAIAFQECNKRSSYGIPVTEEKIKERDFFYFEMKRLKHIEYAQVDKDVN